MSTQKVPAVSLIRAAPTASIQAVKTAAVPYAMTTANAPPEPVRRMKKAPAVKAQQTRETTSVA